MGPLEGIKILEIAGIGPGPFCGMMLADMGAEILRVDKKNIPGLSGKFDVLGRGRRSVTVDLKKSEGVEAVLRLAERADVLMEGYRPGVMERLGLGPEVCLARNPRLVYARMTGWGQYGPLAHAAGHDMNYIAISGALHAIGRAGERPVPPINLVGDFGGGGLLQAYGIVCALLERQRSGKGQVIDTAMTDGAALLMTMMYGFKAAGMWKDSPESNLLDGAAHFYDTYTCKDGRHVAIGSIEPQFYALLLEKTGLKDDPEFRNQMNQRQWPALKAKLQAVFLTRTRDEWTEIMEGTDVCFGPVLSMEEAPRHPHNVARQTFVTRDGVVQPAPAPRFSRTVPELPSEPPKAGQHNDEALADWGFTAAEIAGLKERKVV
ncbi:MAG TPA: CaiB/BaiF CoA-transferase family protein [Candidatus Macondimonas sp.]|nr:CaiB/BaiF CoA-transferase family protein [Candidatus Macondimonas sp.]